MQTEVILHSTTVDAQGVASALLRLRVLNGENVLAEQNHRVTVAPGDNVEEVFAGVSAALQRDGWPAVPSDIATQVAAIAEAGR